MKTSTDIAQLRIQPFARHVYAVQRYVEFTAPRYSALMKSGTQTHPICCFGRLESAGAVTVGLNPSIGEFEPGRWESLMEHDALAERCNIYFSRDAKPPAHPWFSPWVSGLKQIGSSYEQGSAVHLDLSPRATRPVQQLNAAYEESLFLEMVERDLWVFFATLELCRTAKLLMIAGTVTGKYYINEFLQALAPQYGYSLDGAFRRSENPGKGKTQFHFLSGHGRRLPVFFCSSSPSDSANRELLPQRIEENVEQIMQIMRFPTSPAAR